MARGKSSGGTAESVMLFCIPQQALVEGLSGEHREHHDGCKGERAESHMNRRKRMHLNQCRQQRDREYVEHGPAADELDDPEKAAALLRMAHRFARYSP